MISELQRTCDVLGIPYGRSKGVVFHDTRHSAVTNLVGAGVPETIAMTITVTCPPDSPGYAASPAPLAYSAGVRFPSALWGRTVL